MTYDPHAYWTERGKTYSREAFPQKHFALQESAIVEALRSRRGQSVLEVGCGFGRITRLVLEQIPGITRYVASDLSADQIDAARTYVGERPGLEFRVSDIQSLPEGERFDVVLASEVLLHVPPTDIVTVIGCLLGHAQRHLVHIDWWQGSDFQASSRQTSPWNFHHDYPAIYQSLGQRCTIIPIRKRRFLRAAIDAHQAIFCIDLADPSQGA